MISCSKLAPKPYLTVVLRGVVGDDGRGREAVEEVVVGDAVDAHVGVVDVAEEAQAPPALGREEGAEERVMELDLEVLAAGAAEVPLEIDAVGDGGHEGRGA